MTFMWNGRRSSYLDFLLKKNSVVLSCTKFCFSGAINSTLSHFDLLVKIIYFIGENKLLFTGKQTGA